MSGLGFCCVECGSDKNGSKAYIEYSKGTLKLKRCVDCGNLVDKYVEFEWLLIIIDMMLLRLPPFRHVLRNVEISKSRYIKFFFLGILMRFYVQLFLLTKLKTYAQLERDWGFLLIITSQLLFVTLVEHVLIFSILFYLVKTYVSPETLKMHLLKAAILSNYCITINVPMTIWETPTSFVRISEILVLAWLILAIKAITEPHTSWNAVVMAVLIPFVLGFMMRVVLLNFLLPIE
uniref:Protein ARV n=1 Tax=Aplanochytrium stocchinoi TaxID=215587 RepID=A0A7S3LK37_9STRA